MTVIKIESPVQLLFMLCFIILALVPRCVLSQSISSTTTTTKPTICKDDDTYSFGEYIYDDRTYIRTCAWITTTPANIDTRKDTWCSKNKEYQGIIVANICPYTCNRCSNSSSTGTGTGTINRQPIANDPNCIEDQSFTFGSYVYEGIVYDRSCEWMTITPMKKMIRKAIWCDEEWNGNNISEKCPNACNTCSSSRNDNDRRRGRNIRRRSL